MVYFLDIDGNKMDTFSLVVLIALAIFLVILIVLWPSRRAEVLSLKQICDKNTEVDKLNRLKAGFTLIKDITEICIIGLAINFIHNNESIFVLLFGLVLYIIVFVSIYIIDASVRNINKN